jgi:hypothetical protein
VTAADIYTEPDGDPDTLANLGPLAAMAGIWVGAGEDQHPTDPVDQPTGIDAYEERYELQPIDFQTNGPQLLYGLRYHTRLVKPGEVAMFHEQVGFWLWEPATGTVMFTLAIPRGQVALASGRCAPDAKAFEIRAERGSLQYGICTAPFLDANFTTLDFRMTVRINDDGTWSYDQNTRLQLPDRAEVFDHVDANTLRRVAAPTPNPLAVAAGLGAGDTVVAGAGLGIGSLRP